MVGCLVVAVQAEVAGAGLDDRAEVVERAVVVEFFLVGAGEVDRSLVGQRPRRAVDQTAGPLEHAAREIESGAADAKSKPAAADRTVPPPEPVSVPVYVTV